MRSYRQREKIIKVHVLAKAAWRSWETGKEPKSASAVVDGQQGPGPKGDVCK